MRNREDGFLSGRWDLFSQFFDLSPDIWCIAGFDGFFMKVNAAMIKTLGWTEDELLSRPWIEFVQPEDRQLTEAAGRKLSSGKEVIHLENRFLTKNGSYRWFSWTSMPVPEQELIFAVGRDITKQKQTGEELHRQCTDLEEQVQERSAVLRAINRIFREVPFCVTEEQLGRVCLAAAQKLTRSEFGYLGELDQAGKFKTIAISNPKAPASEMPVAEALQFLKYMEVHGLHNRVMMSGEILTLNDQAPHPGWLEPPKDHPAITSFLGVPLKHAGQTFGMIGLVNRKGGYNQRNLEDMRVLAVSVVEAWRRKKAEWKLAQLHRHNELILSSASEGIVGLDLDGNITFVNPAAAKKLGYEAEELLGQNSHAVWHHSKPDGSPFPPEECPILEALRGGRKGLSDFDEDFFWRKDGTGFSVRCSRNPIIQQGRISGAVVSFQDISERKETQEALRKSEETYRQIVETALEGMWTFDAENRVTFANERLAEMSGYPLDEVIGAPISKFIDQEWVEKAATLINKRLRKGIKEQTDFKFRHRDGRELWVIITASPIFDQEGRYAGALGMITDITARKEAEKEISRLASFPQLSPNPVLEVDTQGNITFANPAAHELAQKFDLPGLQAFLPTDMQEILCSAQKGREMQLRREKRINEGVFAIYIYVVPQFQVARLFFLDITERKRAEEAMRQSGEKFRRTFDQSPIGAAIVGLDFRFQRVNAELCRITGYSDQELIARTFMDITHPDDVALGVKLARRLAAGKIDHYFLEKRFLRKDGSTIWVRISTRLLKDSNGTPLYYLPMIEDITAHKQADENLRQSLNRLQKVLGEIVRAMALIVEVRDPYTAGHQRRVTLLAQAIAREMGLPKEQQDAVWCAGNLHDLGKVYVPDGILSRSGELSDIEFAMVKAHSQKGYEILKSIEFPWPVAEIIRQHHERMNGSGYPDGLQGKDILLEARILGVADVVEAMASHRPYRPALGIDEALAEIHRNREILYDAEVVDACLKVFKEKGLKF